MMPRVDEIRTNFIGLHDKAAAAQGGEQGQGQGGLAGPAARASDA
jgi:hypothetical protein